MSKLILLHTSYHLTPIHRRACNAVVSPSLFTPSSLRSQCLRLQSISPSPPLSLRSISARAFDSSSPETKEEESKESDGEIVIKTTTADTKEYPSGEFQFEKASAWKSFVVKLRMLIAFPWQRVKKGSVLTIKLRGQVSDQLKSRFSSGLSLPQICENLMKAAYDPRIPGVYLQIESLNCGWGKVEEIRRHILDFKKSGKFVVAYVPACGEKEYYLASACQEIYAPPSAYFSLFGLTVQSSFIRGVLEKVGIEPQVERIGKYKSAGDQLARTTMSEENCEMLTALLDNIYGNWLDVISSTRGKKREDIENFINEGVYQVEKLKEEGWITNIQYDDEVISMLKERLGVQKEKTLPMVDYRKYSKVQQWTVGLSGGKDKIAIIRASGSISRVQGGVSLPGSSIIGEQFIEKIRTVRESKRYKAAIIRIDSPGGDALASDLMWREIRLLAASKPVIASMSDVAASGGYYMAMAADTIVAENLTLTGSIGVVTGVLEKVGIEPQVERIGKYKSAGDQLARTTMSEENCEMLTALLDNIYGNWLDVISSTRGKKREDIENFINEGVYQVEKLKEEGWITNIQYDDEVISMLKERLGVQKEKTLPMVDYRKYSKVRQWTVGLSGGKDKIAIIRASGSISRVQGGLSLPGSSIIGEQFIEKIRTVRESKRYKAAIIRIDSPGGDALASDLMWREIRLLAASKPVIASMSDVAASGGYYMAMAADTIVAENLTLTGSIGVVTGKFNLGKLYEKIGFNKEIISRGKYAEVLAAEQRSFRPEEAEIFAKSAQNAYKQFRDKAALSRSMTVDKMEEVAQGRVWTGNDAASRGLVDAIGGLSRAVAIAKLKANIPQDKQVALVELARPSPTLPEILSGIGASLVGVDRTMKDVLQELTFSGGVQARMEGIMFQRLEGASQANPIFSLIKDYFASL
ncbi:hypothetical protein C1H46_033695 [Malus baccata]|uniref:Peptidase S49 domain-containing protein n=1 Tax=Malus baccata TaxID=106549 RepID=A0A540L2T3_MALBA|nr:hypothetical protein C1H46_033695 [Malus baccata]